MIGTYYAGGEKIQPRNPAKKKMLVPGPSACSLQAYEKNKPKARDRATPRPTRTAYNVLRQIVQWIPEGFPDRIAREVGADIRTFSCTSHVLALLYGQISPARAV